MGKFFAVILVCSCLSVIAGAQRLPGNIVPVHYQLQLDPDLATGVLNGVEIIDVQVLSQTSTIVLNAVDLKLSHVTVNADATPDAAVTYDAKQEMVTLQLPRVLNAGPARITFQFSGKIRDDLRGLYFSKTARRRYIATQFEGTYARMAFPCFDEPAYKATFDISVTADSDDTAISNGKIAEVKATSSGKHLIRFETSPKMSSYLVALAVGDFKCQEGSADGIPIRICAVPEKVGLAKFALHSAESFMRFYNRYYSIKYPFAKLDMVAFPDYEWGGMENTASIFYKERALLIDEKTAPVGVKRGVAGVVAHEMAHQWFGDLVTMKWWDNIWLNEGFATWMTPHALEEWDPSWDQSVEEVRLAGAVMAEDSLEDNRAIHATAVTPDEIKEMFDGVAYGKGAIVLRMIESYLGGDNFRAGTNKYLTRFANGNATAEDFSAALAKVSNEPVEKIMAGYVNQAGTPLVSITAACEGDHTKLTLSQSRFYSNAKLMQSASPELWTIPVCMHEAKSKTQCKLLSQRSDIVTFPGCGQAIVGNAGGHGVYLTAYDADSLRRLSAVAASLSPAERASLISNQWILTKVGKVGVPDFMKLASSLSRDKNRVVLSTVLDAFREAGERLAGNDLPTYRKWVRMQVAPQYQVANRDPASAQTDDDKAKEALAFAILGWTQDPSTLAQAKEIVKRFQESPGSVDPSIAATALTTAARSGDKLLYSLYKAKLKEAATPQQHSAYLFAIASFTRPELVQQNIALLDSSDIRQQDVSGFLSELLSNPESRDQAWGYMKNHWGTLQRTAVSFGGGGAVAALGSYCDEGHRKEIAHFFSQHPAPGAERTVKKTIENIDNCIEFRKRQQDEFQKWLASTGTASSTSTSR